MRMLGMLGGVANGWLKFFVALAAVGWFGFQALDRVTGFSPAESVESMLVTEETPSNEVAAEDQLIKDDAVKPAVFVSKNIQDMSVNDLQTEATRLAKNPSSGVIFGMMSAFALGLVTRPGFDWFQEKRKLRGAKKRAKQYEEDRQRLAEFARMKETAAS